MVNLHLLHLVANLKLSDFLLFTPEPIVTQHSTHTTAPSRVSVIRPLFFDAIWNGMELLHHGGVASMIIGVELKAVSCVMWVVSHVNIRRRSKTLHSR